MWLSLGKLVHELSSSEDLSQRSQTNKRQTPDKKIRILRQADGERTILGICGENNSSEQTFHRSKKEFGLLDVKQAKRLKDLEVENTRLKRIVADQVPGMEIIQEALEKTRHKRQMAEGLVARGGFAENGVFACPGTSLVDEERASLLGQFGEPGQTYPFGLRYTGRIPVLR